MTQNKKYALGLNVAVSGAVSADIEEQARTLVNLTM